MGSSAFDIYVSRNGTDRFACVFDLPLTGYTDGYDDIIGQPWLPKGRKEITINFPLYSGVTELWIGLNRNSTLEKRADYKIGRHVLYYGSSITQGGCASRPGMAYEAIISRRLDADFINLGFNGSARGTADSGLSGVARPGRVRHGLRLQRARPGIPREDS